LPFAEKLASWRPYKASPEVGVVSGYPLNATQCLAKEVRRNRERRRRGIAGCAQAFTHKD
jgi:hypothetical protein